MIKVQCISNRSGFHQKLNIGEWYDVEEYISSDGKSDTYIVNKLSAGKPKSDVPISVFHMTLFGLYDKSLFRTLQDKRDSQLNKIL
jgi:hypothetical protein